MTHDQRVIRAAAPVIGEEEIEAAVRVLRGGMVAQGPEVAAFEEEFSKFVDGRHCVAVNSGTSALHLSLMALGIGPGDEVIVPSFTFAATANAVRLVGATPVFADIERDSFCLSPEAAEAAVTPRTAAIMPVHLYGHPAAMGPLTELAERHGLAIVEDAAQAHAASLDGTPVGAFGAAACFSFYPTKNMHSLEGGMITTGDVTTARTLRLLRNQGMEQRYANEIVGFNVRMTDVAAAIGRVQLRSLDTWTRQRRANAAALDAGLRAVVTPPVARGAKHVYHQYTIRVTAEGGKDRDTVSRELQERGVGNAVYYPTPVHRLAPFRTGEKVLGYAAGDLPETERAAAEALSVPVHPMLTAQELEQLTATVNEVVGGRA
ncbi:MULTISPECIES: DegT/DnrJ/EryC1/StrS family aminotransferase [unclassified Streptomyces]|uniref:DegT/DnrJ/EryC1/StrS family aminotransferase n=1 Tax=unclassified Streptomyces TaxID=2593676 RepID=UPI003450D607